MIYMDIFEKYIFNEVIIALLEHRIVPQIDNKAYEDNKVEIIEQFLGSGIENGLW